MESLRFNSDRSSPQKRKEKEKKKTKAWLLIYHGKTCDRDAFANCRKKKME